MRYVFGDYSLDTQRYELRRAGERIPLGPQVFNVLAYLVAHRGRVVSRDELFARLWPDQFVTDDALGRCVRAARRALQDAAEAPRYLLTTRGRGYRFIAPVHEQPDAPPDDGVLPIEPSQSMSLQPSAASSAPLQPASPPTVSAARQRLSEECGLPSLVLAVEYKPVTVLCGGLSDATALARRLGPEAMHRLMQTVFTAVHQVMQRYAGSLIEFSGEGFLALFGAPVAQEDHAQRAVLAALTLSEQLGTSAPALRQSPGGLLAMGLGLHTGRVVVDRLGGEPQRLYTAAGETTQVAMRLRQLAAPGVILLSAATQDLVQEDVWVEPQGEVTVGDTHAPVPVYGVRGIARRRSGVVGHGARVRSPFVGRERELALLHERLDAVVAGQGQVVAIVAEPGMGKSRLLAEYRHGLVGRQVRYAEGHCLSYGSAVPYLPIVDLVRQLCGMHPGEPHDAITAKVQQRLQEADIAPDEGVPLVLSLLDIPLATERLVQLSPPERKARTFALLRHLVLHEAQQHPCILTVENLHWIDPTSEEWLTSLVERLPGTTTLVLVTYRPGYQPPWLAQSYATQIALSPLRAGESRTVVQAVLRSTAVPETVVQEILGKAAGNPFFLEELAWNVVEHGGQPVPLAVPETVEAVLAARLDRLPPEEKRLLQTAAVIGMQVAVPLLQAVTDRAAAELLTHLSHLQTAEFLYETGGRPAGAYTFKHALTQEVAYGCLLQEQRRALHARIVEALEALAGERVVEQVERLAHHALQGEVWDKALLYCWQAGGKATDRSAYLEAVAYLEQALAAWRHLPDDRATLAQAIDLRLHLRAVLSPLGSVQRALDLLREAEADAASLHDHRRLGQVVFSMVGCWWLLGAPERAVAYAERACALAATLGESDLQRRATVALGQSYVTMGHYRQAVDWLTRTSKVLPGERRPPRFGGASGSAVMSRAWLAWSLAELGQFEAGRLPGAEALQMAEAAGHPMSCISACYGLGLLHLRRGDLAQAIPVLEQGLGVCQAWGLHALSFHGVAAFLGAAYVLAGRVTEALPLLERVVAQTDAMGIVFDHVLGVIPLGEGYLRAGRIADARQQAQHAVDLCRQHHQHGHEAWALRLLGEVAAQRHPAEVEQAISHYQQALTLADALGMRPLQAHCHRGLGRLYAMMGQREQARTELSTAIEMYRAMDMTFWLPETEAALAQMEAQ
jgi:class 3 adenylate cyclase/tetratricopeptide (TPR) repeat protein